MKRAHPIIISIGALVAACHSYAAGPAFSGLAATADSAETVASNPAGMARLTESSFFGNPMVVVTKSETDFSSESGGSGSVDSDSVIVVPGFYYVRPLNDKWTFGIGPNGASGIGTSYGDDWAGRYLLDEWSLVFAGIAPALSYRVDEKLSLGFSVPLTYSKFTLNKAVFNGVGEDDGEMEFEADGFGVGFTIGLLYEFDENNRIGIAYNSEITVKEDGRPDFSGLTPGRKSVLDSVGVLDQNIELESTRPQFLVVGYFHDFGNGWSATIDGLWIDYSEMGVSDVMLGDTALMSEGSDYQDMWGVSVGARWQYDENWAYRVGAGYLSSALDESDRTVFSRMGETYAIGGGVEYTTSKGRIYGLDITYIQFSDGKFSIEDAPVIGDITGEYSTNYGIAISFSSSW